MQNTLKNHLSGELLTIATCWKLRFSSGELMGFTDHDEDLNIDELIYKSSSGFTASSILSNSNLKIDNLEIEGALNSDEIKEEDVFAGRYDFANIEMFLVNYKNLNQGKMNLHSGTFGKIILNNGRFIAEIRGISAKLDTKCSRVILSYM